MFSESDKTPVSGESILSIPAGILSIDSPETGVLSDSENILITIRNFGIDPINNFDVFYQINNENQIIETITETIDSGQELNYSFTETYDFSVIGDYEITSGTILARIVPEVIS